MQLADHLGEIVRKARETAEISSEVAAKAAGLNVSEFAQFEEQGKKPNQINLNSLATLLGLNAARLQKIAQGWLPPAIDLSQWRELRQITTAQEGIEVHCYLVWDEVSREAALFDTGWDAAPILKLIAENDSSSSERADVRGGRERSAVVGGIVERTTVRAVIVGDDEQNVSLRRICRRRNRQREQ